MTRAPRHPSNLESNACHTLCVCCVTDALPAPGAASSHPPLFHRGMVALPARPPVAGSFAVCTRTRCCGLERATCAGFPELRARRGLVSQRLGRSPPAHGVHRIQAHNRRGAPSRRQSRLAGCLPYPANVPLPSLPLNPHGGARNGVAAVGPLASVRQRCRSRVVEPDVRPRGGDSCTHCRQR